MNNEPTFNKSQTDWTRLDRMEDEDIDFSDCQEITPEMFKSATIRRGVTLTPEKKPLPYNYSYSLSNLQKFK